MEGYGFSYGAITVVNAFANGIGAAIGVDLTVEVYVKSSRDMSIKTFLNNNEISIDDNLIREIIRIFRNEYGLSENLHIEIYSQIPPEKGLKSSSAVANATIMALADALNITLDHNAILNINMDASLNSGVSVTGALDDASSSLLGGLVITDNLNRRIIDRKKISLYNVVITYPQNKGVKTSKFKKIDFKPIKKFMASVINLLYKDLWKEAMFLNGLIYSGFIGYSTKPIFHALRNGAYTASLTGKGPAYIALTDDSERIRKVWKRTGWREIITVTR